jgi:hypothetical protein
MAKLPVRSFALLALATVIICPAFAAKPAKEKGDAKKAGEVLDGLQKFDRCRSLYPYRAGAGC